MAAANNSRLLTPGQAQLALQLAKMGTEQPTLVAEMLRVPEERLRRSFRLDLPAQAAYVDPVAYLQHIGQVRLTPIPEGED